MARITTAVILARGLGTRMRASGAQTLDAENAAVAATGVKALIRFGRPFLDHVLHDLAEAGINDVVLVIGPEHQELRHYYQNLALSRLRIRFALQAHAKGTADAVACVESAVDKAPFLVLNSDNLYPTSALRPLAAHDSPGLVGFRRSGLLTGNIVAERVAKFALITADDNGHLAGIIEKPNEEQITSCGADPLLSMNCWAFDHTIFAACAAIKASPRGEFELPDAVAASMASGTRYRIIERCDPVLDLSSRDDVPAVRSALEQHAIHL
jgi:dTDP-glucose pyrophosphorylase